MILSLVKNKQTNKTKEKLESRRRTVTFFRLVRQIVSDSVFPSWFFVSLFRLFELKHSTSAETKSISIWLEQKKYWPTFRNLSHMITLDFMLRMSGRTLYSLYWHLHTFWNVQQHCVYVYGLCFVPIVHQIWVFSNRASSVWQQEAPIHSWFLQVSCSVWSVLGGRTYLCSESHEHHSSPDLSGFASGHERTLRWRKPAPDSSVRAQGVSQNECHTPPVICQQSACGLSEWGRCSTCEFPCEPA